MTISIDSLVSDAFTQAEYAINITDTEGVLLRVNQAYLDLYGYSGPSEVLGKTQRLIRSPFTPQSIYTEMWSTIKGGHIWRGEMTNRGKGGQDVYVHLSISPILREGKPVGFMGFSLNRSQQVNLERQLLHANKLMVLGTLGAGLAHEINNPLASILLDAEYLREELAKGNADTNAMAAADSMIRGVERIRRVLKHLLLYSKKDNLNETFSIDMGGLLEESLLFIERQITGRGIQLHCAIPRGFNVRGNPTQLESVFHNLLTNSRDAFEDLVMPGKRISITGDSKEGILEILYRDNAGGISQELIARIFEPFFTTKAEGQGTGLGLSLTRKILADHGGYIHCESQGGETLFRILLPLAPEILGEDCPTWAGSDASS